MKKTLKILIVFAFLAINSLNCLIYADGFAYPAMGTHQLEVGTCVWLGGIWGNNTNESDYMASTKVSTNSFEITLYPKQDEPWNYLCKISLKNFVIPDRKTQKEHQKGKNAKSFEYDCDIEFFYSVDYPSVEECFANYGMFMVNAKDNAKKRTVSGKIQFNKYFFSAGEEYGYNDDEQMVAVLSIDNVGLAIDFLTHLKF